MSFIVSNAICCTVIKSCLITNINKSSPVSLEECVATPHGREFTRLLHMLLAAQCPLQTSPITQP